MEPVAYTDRGTPVYHLQEIPKDLLPLKKNSPPTGPFAAYLVQTVGIKACVIIKHRSSVRIFKVGQSGDVFPVTARAIRIEDRKRLVAEGILRRS